MRPARVRTAGTAAITLTLVAGLLVSVGAAVTVGPADLSIGTVWAVIGEHLGLAQADVSVLRDHIVWDLRLPRVLAAAAVGAGLAAAGAVMQTVTRNPLADPYLLGVSSGAALGAVLVIVAGIGGGMVAVSGGAFAGALATFAVVVLIAGRRGALSPARVVLTGVAIAQLCAACTSFVIIWVGDPNATQSITFWLSGSLAGATWAKLAWAIPALAAVLLLVLTQARTLNAFAFGEEAAATLGVDVTRTRWLLLIATALLTAVLVAISGAIGFVGLILPHAARFLAGPDHRRLLPVVVPAGAIFLIWVDTAARTVFEPRELPVGVLTALLGVPAFLMLLRRREVRG
ncbi:iron chelate uptake ABC transporter family permease subunit [Actinoplanes sp. NEAU-A12]|uniref:Iron chelate uptake ABC transporter family permease subunit n=1 Tax=Actinoplanes sandaracinus TaxID=3045177 RepID=A0ABT6WYT1_9ACTN|nr:iron chelate uptake ABC transporter family permease subunit [Actinoplanes sandaracinus]MDI6104766.1 iron chelate uptake ABC transporter family permease subunit [Actinoplanes sandaracinus]